MGTRLLADAEIQKLLAEKKPLAANWQTRLKPRPKSDMRFMHRELAVTGEEGHQFRIVLRTNLLNPLDFSIILTFIDVDGCEYRLLRYNGKHPSEHTNKFEYRTAPRKGPNRFRNTCHIHQATERYQVAGYDIDGYARVTLTYGSFESALDQFVRSNGFAVQPDDPTQGHLFPP